jgi:CRISPR-associated protein Csc1
MPGNTAQANEAAMHIQRCTLTLQESVYYATREMGTLYETGNYLHNYGLTYALFNDAFVQVPYFCNSYRPTYADDLLRVQQAGIYVTPAAPMAWSYLLATWKIGQVSYYRKSEQFQGRNYPANIGRAKELAPESTFVCYVISTEPVRLPRWVRIGKWHSKVLVEAASIEVKVRTGDYTAVGPLNPLDVPDGVLHAFDIISMPPSSLVMNARCSGDYYEIGGSIGIPASMRFVTM